MPEYRPTVPYVIQSGKHGGKTLELLMFQKYPLLNWWIGKLNKENPTNKNSFHRHLEWLFAQGENRTARKLCPQCGDSEVRSFSSLGDDRFGYSIYPIYTCCGNDHCRQKLHHQAAGAAPYFYPIKFSSIMHYRRKFDQKMVVNLLRAVYELPNRLTAKIAFEFFLE